MRRLLLCALITATPSALAQSPILSCGTLDDGVAEHAFGLTSGGEIGWLHAVDCLLSIDRIEAAYGTSVASPTGNPPPNGNASRIVCYEDVDCDGDPRTPAGGMTILWSVSTVTVNTGTNLLHSVPAPSGASTSVPSHCAFVMATANHLLNELPAPMDTSNPTSAAWIVGSTPIPSSLDIANLLNNNVPPLDMDGLSLPTAFLLRAQGTEAPPYPPSCFGDGSGASCACGNDGAPGDGCTNSTGNGARIVASGTASLSSDSFALTITQLPDTPGLTFQGDVAIANPPIFGDGLRCCGQNLVRWITVQAAGGCASTDLSCGQQLGGMGGAISQHPANGGLSAGDTRCYQHWYRDPGGANPCGTLLFNLSPAIVATWGP